MPEEFFMFDSVNADRQVTAADFAKYYNELLTNGVFYRNNVPSLKATKGAGMSSNVEMGAAFIDGYLYRNTTDKALIHTAANASNPRIDRIVIRLNRNIANRDIRLIIKTGVPATNPIPPVLERNDLIHELSIAQVLVNAAATTTTSIQDERLDQTLCGVVSSLVQPPTDVYRQEWDEFIGSIQSEAPALGGMTISVQTTPPVGPMLRDIWIDTSS